MICVYLIQNETIIPYLSINEYDLHFDHNVNAKRKEKKNNRIAKRIQLKIEKGRNKERKKREQKEMKWKKNKIKKTISTTK